MTSICTRRLTCYSDSCPLARRDSARNQFTDDTGSLPLTKFWVAMVPEYMLPLYIM
jgi:hypothetical protein